MAIEDTLNNGHTFDEIAKAVVVHHSAVSRGVRDHRREQMQVRGRRSATVASTVMHCTNRQTYGERNECLRKCRFYARCNAICRKFEFEKERAIQSAKGTHRTVSPPTTPYSP